MLFRIAQDPKLWYYSFLSNYPCWASRVEYGQRLISWRDFVIHLAKQQNTTKHFTFDFAQEVQRYHKRKLSTSSSDVLENSSKHKKTTSNSLRSGTRHYELRKHEKNQFWIEDPLIANIDRTTKTGVVATGKHRKNVYGIYPRSEHKILFWEYPSWRLIRSFELNLTPAIFTCQIIGVQSIRMPTSEGTKKVRFFSLAVGTPMEPGTEPENEDRVDFWKAVFVYRLNDDGSTQCVAHVKVDNLVLGREIFLFSDASWARSNDGDDDNDEATAGDKLQD
jgi:hypothetical protein